VKTYCAGRNIERRRLCIDSDGARDGGDDKGELHFAGGRSAGDVVALSMLLENESVGFLMLEQKMSSEVKAE